MRRQPPPTPPSDVDPRQLNIPLDSERLRGISQSDRRTTLVVRLARLLSEAAGVAEEERDDDER